MPEDEPIGAQLWPEHFDLAVSAAKVNYGVSPGDVHIAELYLYVGPFDGASSGDEFWNAPFGAILRHHEVTSAAQAAVNFFSTGPGSTTQPSGLRSRNTSRCAGPAGRKRWPP